MDVQRFFRRVPRLFWARHAREAEAYHRCIYLARRPVTPAEIERGVRFARGSARETAAIAESLDDALEQFHYPAVRPLLRLAPHGIALPTATALLHFQLPSYPIYRPEAVEGLAVLGRGVPAPGALDEPGLEGYARFVGELDALKEAIPYAFVPEAPYFLSRIVEASLCELAARSETEK